MDKVAGRTRIVIDTNVWLSGLVYGGEPGRILKAFAGADILVVVSEELLSELRNKVTHKFPLFIPRLSLLEASIRKDAILVRLGTHPVAASRDPKDNMVLETAFVGRCGYVVSGDKDLLILKSYEGIQIVKPAEFLQMNTPSYSRNV